jgi:hypothetical protein
MNEQPEFEELEQIPWAALAARANDPWRRVSQVVLGALAVLLLGLLAARWLFSGDEATIMTLPAVASSRADVAASAADVAVAGEAVPPDPVEVTVTSSEPSVYSEADLMAISVPDESRLAAMRAEWLVQDFFTVDGDDGAAQGLAAVVGEHSLPQHAPAGYSYVEWARSFAISSPQPGRYAVDVAFRTLVTADAGGFVRTDPRAVTVIIDVDVDGTTQLVDLPSPATLPEMVEMSVATIAPAEASAEMTATALRIAASIGSDPAVLDVGQVDGGWRFVVEIGDRSGNRWPIMIRR